MVPTPIYKVAWQLNPTIVCYVHDSLAFDSSILKDTQGLPPL
jgi:hypothetical protein